MSLVLKIGEKGRWMGYFGKCVFFVLPIQACAARTTPEALLDLFSGCFGFFGVRWRKIVVQYSRERSLRWGWGN